MSNSSECIIITKLFYQIFNSSKSVFAWSSKKKYENQTIDLNPIIDVIIKIFPYNSSVIWERGGYKMGKYSKLKYPNWGKKSKSWNKYE